MAKCKRCGTSFDYDRREGVCPRCCFYNRPPGMPYHDDGWIESYNIEENTYELPKSILEAEEEDPGALFRRRKKEKELRQEFQKNHKAEKDCHTEGSHVHTDAGKARPVRRRVPDAQSTTRTERARRTHAGLIPVAAAITVLIVLAAGYMSMTPDDTAALSEEFEIHQIDMEVLQEGAEIGSLTYYLNDPEAVVLFEEGELPELPPGEKCIGIHLEDNESILDHHIVEWEAPYVYDGSYYRELIVPSNLDSAGQFDQFETDFMLRYTSSLEDFDGMAVFFVDKKADKVTLCIPEQTLDGETVLCQGVTEVEIPIQKAEQADQKGE